MLSFPRRQRLARPFRRYLVAKCLISAAVAWSVMSLVWQAIGFSFLDIGLLNSFGAVVSLAFEVPMGRVADRYGQRQALTWGAVFIAVGLAILAIFDAVTAIYVSEFIVGIGLALSSGADSAWLFAEHKRLGLEDQYLDTRSAIGSKTTLFSIGASATAPVLFSWGTGIPLWVTAFLYLSAAGVWAGLVVHPREKAFDQDASKAQVLPTQSVLRRSLAAIGANRLFVSLSLASMLIVTAVSNFSTYIGPFMESRGLDVRFLGAVLLAGQFARWLAIRNTFRLKRPTHQQRLRILVAVGLAILVLLAISTIFPRRPWAGAIAFVAISGLSTLFFTLLDEQVNLVISDRYRSTMLSIVAMFDEVATIAIDPLIGAMLDAVGFSRAYLLLAAIIALLFLAAMATAYAILRRS